MKNTEAMNEKLKEEKFRLTSAKQIQEVMDDEVACVCVVSKDHHHSLDVEFKSKTVYKNAFSFVQQLAAQRKRKTTSNGRSNVTSFVWSSASRVD